MSLTKQQRTTLQQIYIHAYASHERDGKAYYDSKGKKEFIVPQFGDILTMMFDKIKQAGFTTIQRCSPAEANCIIRIYQDFHHKYEWGLTFNIYGAECYTKNFGTWETTDTRINHQPLEYDKCQFRMVLLPDESLYVDADFVDCYVKVS